MIHRKGVFGRLKVTFVKWCEEEKNGEENGAISGTHISRTNVQFLSNLVCRVAYMEGINM